MNVIAKTRWLIALAVMMPFLVFADENALSLGSWQDISRDEANISANGLEGKVRLRKKLRFLDDPDTFAEVLVFDKGTLLFRHDKSLDSIPTVSNKNERKKKLLKYLSHEEIKPLKLQPFSKVNHTQYQDQQSGGMVMLTSTIAKGTQKTCFLFYKAKSIGAKTVVAESAEGVFCETTKKIPSIKEFTASSYKLARSFVFDKGRHAQEFAVSVLAEKLDQHYLNVDQKGPTVKFTYAEYISASNRYILSGKVTDKTGAGFIKINGIRLTDEQMKSTINSSGNFNIDVRVQGGRPGILNMVFADRAKNATIKTYGVDVKELRSGPRPKPQPIVLKNANGRGKTYALLVAVGSYQDKSLTSLFSPVPDVKKISASLRSIGVKAPNMFTLYNPSKSQFIETVDKIKEKFSVGDQLIVYYSGHGVLSSKTKEGYWSFRDTAAEPMRPKTWLSNNELRKRLLEFTKGGVLIVADSCFSGSFVKHYFDNANSLQFNSREEARTTLTSGGIAPVADTANGRSINSEFAVSFLQALKRMKTEAKKRNETDVPGFFLYGLTAKQQRLKHQPLPNYGSFVDVVYIDRKVPDFSLNIH